MKDNKKRRISEEQRERNLKKFRESYKPLILQKFYECSPRLYEDVTAIHFDAPIVTESPNCYLYGAVGTGKTVMAARMALNWAENRYASGKTNISCEIINVEEWLENLRASFNNTLSSYHEILEKYENTSLLILDDIGIRPSTDWALTVLYLLINHRHNRFYPTIYTSNGSLSELAEKLNDDRIPDRIQYDCNDDIFELTKYRRSHEES